MSCAPPSGNMHVQSSAEFWLFAGSWAWIALLPCMFSGEDLISVPRLCWESLRSTGRWLAGNKWLLNGSGGWFQKILLLTLPPVHVYLTVCMSNLIMKECPQGAWSMPHCDTRGLVTRTRDPCTLRMLHQSCHTQLLLLQKWSFIPLPYSVLTVLGARVASISHTKETVPCKGHGPHHLNHLPPNLPNKSHYCLST